MYGNAYRPLIETVLFVAALAVIVWWTTRL